LTPPTAIDLFAGCGGFSTGLLDAGVRVLAGFEHERRAVEVFDYNHLYRGAKGHILDLGKATGADLLRLAGVPRVDMVVGGPPCQAFSIIGKQRGTDDERGTLLFDFVRLVGDVTPKAFILENVPNLAQIDKGRIYEKVKVELAALGYAIRAEVLAVAKFGVPQMRKRLFMVGIRDLDTFPYPPPPTHDETGGGGYFARRPKYRTVSEALDDLPDVVSTEADAVPNHEPTIHSPSMLAALAALPQGTRDPKSHHDRLHPDRLSYTLRAGSGNFSPLRPIHHRYDRVISVRESARLQGFADTFIWPDVIPRLQQYRQVGNAVPPPIAAAIARHIAGIVGWTLDPALTKGDPTGRTTASTSTAEERRLARLSRIRGASLGGRALDAT
jgi:DNA (cytosine-5)-methyltransferase 1